MKRLLAAGALTASIAMPVIAADNTPTAAFPPAPNLTRITVQGSTNAPAEWLRLTIDPSRNAPFTWVNVPYCNDPNASCQ